MNDLVGHGRDEMQKEVGGDSGHRFLMQLDKGELGRSIDLPCPVRTSAMSIWK